MSVILPDQRVQTEALTETKDEFQTIEIVYIGRRNGPKNELYEAYITLSQYNTYSGDRAGVLEQIMSLFQPPKQRSVPQIVGGVYDMECLTEHFSIIKCRNGRWIYKYRLFDTAQVVAWQEADRAAWTKGSERRSLVKIKEEDLLLTNMEFLRAAYQKCNPADRIGFELAVLRRLRAP